MFARGVFLQALFFFHRKLSKHYRYNQYLSAMKKTEESLRRLKKGQTSSFSLFRSANTVKDEEARDQERIRTQMIIDVNAFAKEAESVGVDVLGNHAFALLSELARANFLEGESLCAAPLFRVFQIMLACRLSHGFTCTSYKYVTNMRDGSSAERRLHLLASPGR